MEKKEKKRKSLSQTFMLKIGQNLVIKIIMFIDMCFFSYCFIPFFISAEFFKAESLNWRVWLNIAGVVSVLRNGIIVLDINKWFIYN